MHHKKVLTYRHDGEKEGAMSSFVIGKEEYIKAAGLIAGIAKVKRDQIFVYDYEKDKKISTPEEWRDKFVQMFDMNALSVQEQYHEKEVYTDGCDYEQIFKKAYQIGINAAMGGDLKDWIMKLRNFFHCAIYQTEKDAYFFKMQMFFYAILDQLMRYMHAEPDNWGDLDI